MLLDNKYSKLQKKKHQLDRTSLFFVQVKANLIVRCNATSFHNMLNLIDINPLMIRKLCKSVNQLCCLIAVKSDKIEAVSKVRV